jgi:hypothetical protein
MKSVRNSLSVLMLVLLVSAVGTDSLAQGRGRGNGNPGRGHNKENHPGRGHDKSWKNNERDHDHDYRDDRKHRHYTSYHTGYNYRDRYVTYNHHRHGSPSWAPAYGHRYNTRYIYYRDYNVYYDCHRDVFVTWTGRNWAITTHIPRILVGVDFNHCAVAGVDYWDDDFNFYLERRSPAFVSIRASF